MGQVISVREDTGRRRVQTVFEDESLTVQSDRKKSELKEILRRYDQTGVLVGMRDVDLAFRDVSEFDDFKDVMLAAKFAETAFMKLPSKVREVFGHDVSEWLDCAHDAEKLEEKRDALTRLGVFEEVTKQVKPQGLQPPPSEGE